VEPGALDRLGALAASEVGAHRWAVVADGTVAGLYGDRALAALREDAGPAELFTFPPGEGSKTRDEWRRLTDEVLAAGHGRDSAVVALGGGVTGDLAGFVAATFMRGVDVVQAPTTLLAMLDSSVGGKTAVDTERGKNLVGAFHHPALVVADPRTLETLPDEHVAAGLAEAVKAAAIADARLVGWMEERSGGLAAGDPGPLGALVRRCVEIKAEVVGEDPEEAGRRQVLNFGHTVGHALEALAGWDVLHGDAVAAGMRVEARLGEALGVTEEGTARRLEALLAACGHTEPLEAGLDAGRVLEAMGTDKKARRGVTRVVLLDEVGRVARGEDGGWAHPLPEGRTGELLAGALEPG
jgi:3-dehydroquinate synthase